MRNAGIAIESALAAFPDFDKVAQAASKALDFVVRRATLARKKPRAEIRPRLDAKEIQLGHAIRLALGVEAKAYSGNVWLYEGENSHVTTEQDQGAADSARIDLDLPQGWDVMGDSLWLKRMQRQATLIEPTFDPAVPPAPAIALSVRTGGKSVSVRLPFERPPLALPPLCLDILPEAGLINRAENNRTIEVTITNLHPRSLNGN